MGGCIGVAIICVIILGILEKGLYNRMFRFKYVIKRPSRSFIFPKLGNCKLRTKGLLIFYDRSDHWYFVDPKKEYEGDNKRVEYIYYCSANKSYYLFVDDNFWLYGEKEFHCLGRVVFSREGGQLC